MPIRRTDAPTPSAHGDASGAPTPTTIARGHRRPGSTGRPPDPAWANDRSPIPDLARDILEELVQARMTRSAVILAESLVTRGRMSALGDPVGLVVMSLEGLCEEGFIVYRLGYGGVPTEIRVTRTGCLAVGYLPHREVGRRHHLRDDAATRRADPTDFTALGFHTWGGPVERMLIGDHLIAYPDHRAIHQAFLDDLEAEGGDMPRPRLTPEARLRAIREVNARGTAADFPTADAPRRPETTAEVSSAIPADADGPWPVLRGLRGIVAEVAALRSAADLLQPYDPATAGDLRVRAEKALPTLAIEYLTYATVHPEGDAR